MNIPIENSIEKILKEDKNNNNPIPDPLRFAYLYPYKKEVTDEIGKILKNDSYQAGEIYRIDVPKENYTIRPMARPNVIDWVLYQYIIESIKPYITDKISLRSYSILNFKNPKKKVDPWKRFENESLNFYKKEYTYCVCTDISGYFENIHLQELRSKILNYIPGSDTKVQDMVNILFSKILYRWSMGRLKDFGLPQGPQASSFLGDIYLDNIDRSMESFEGYMRYMDDIRIFCKTKIEARVALIKLIKELRKYKLNINSKKTRIYEGVEVVSIFDKEREYLNLIQDIFESKDRAKIKTILPLVVAILREAFCKDHRFSTRHIRFCLFRLSMAKNSGIEYNYDSIIHLIIKNFIDKPHLSDLFCGFLVQFPDLKVKEFFLSFISSEENIYEWQELYVLRSILEIFDSFDEDIIDLFIRKFKDKNNHWAVRSLYALLVGKYGDNTRREQIKDGFFEENNDELKKNIILAVQELGSASRNDFYANCKDEINPIFFVKYVKSLKNNMYFWPYEKIKIDEFKQEDLMSRYE
jgi:hypothetical protein